MTRFRSVDDPNFCLVFGTDELTDWQVDDLLLFCSNPKIEEGDIIFLHKLTSLFIAGDSTVIFDKDSVTVKAYCYDGTYHSYKFKPEAMKDFWHIKNKKVTTNCFEFMTLLFEPVPITTMAVEYANKVIPVRKKRKKTLSI